MRLIFIQTLFLCAFALSTAPTLAQADQAMALAAAVSGRSVGRDSTTVTRMQLTERGRAPRVRDLVAYRLDRGRGLSSNLIRFLEPQDIAGIGLLSTDALDNAGDQWLYLPELDRVRRISGDRKGGRFVGSDIYFEDLQERKPTRDRHRLVGNDSMSGTLCTLLESTPIDPADSVYRKRVSWVDEQSLLVYRIDYFERDDVTPSKRWVLLAKKRIQGYWTVTDSRITDLKTGHETRMTVETAIYDRKLPTKLFTSQALADESIESEFRP